jgi:pyruvate/2-oxoglutarate dehydrogenase complex dihydrolipoamide acyltransferase (E2) component
VSEPVRFALPDIGEGLVEGEVVAWLVAEGDTVERDQPLVEVLTDKATVELPSPVAGTVARLLAAPGQVVPVGHVLVELLPTGAAPPPAVAPAPSAASAPAAPPPPAGATEALRPKAAPATRQLAAELGVDLRTVTGSGPGGRITAEDVRATRAPAAGDAPAPRPPSARGATAGTHPLRGIRRVTAASMTRSWTEVPHIHVGDTVDAGRLVELVERLAARRPDGPPVTPLVLFVAAVARALRAHPGANASIDVTAGTYTVHGHVHVGFAVATDAGLVVPVVHDADRRSVVELAAEIRRLVDGSRRGELLPADLHGGTATVSNYGRFGGEWATPLIHPPEAVIVGFGAIRPRPTAVGDRVEVRPTLPLVVGADHRLVDGDLAVAFLTTVAALLAEPLDLLLEPGAG